MRWKHHPSLVFEPICGAQWRMCSGYVGCLSGLCASRSSHLQRSAVLDSPDFPFASQRRYLAGI